MRRWILVLVAVGLCLWGDAGTQSFSTREFRLFDTTDSSKVIVFDASAIATGTIRTTSMPNQNVTVGGIVRKNSGANVGTRPRLNLIEGANVTLVVTDDVVDNEVDVMITSTGGVGGGLADAHVMARIAWGGW